MRKITFLWKNLLLLAKILLVERRLPGRIENILVYYPKFGLLNGIKLANLKNDSQSQIKKEVRVRIPNIKHNIMLRRGTTDINVFDQIFLNGEYNLPINIKPKLIIDCGAYVGYSSMYFLNKFPKVKLIAIEPEPTNFEMLKKNLKHYDNVELIKSGIWSEPTYLKVYDYKKEKWGCQVKKCKPTDINSFKAVDINSLLQKSGENEIDILKIDIEGSEKELFSKNFKKWLNKTKILIIELHERDSPGCTKIFNRAIKHYKFKKIKHGENILYLIKNKIINNYNSLRLTNQKHYK